MLKFFRKHARGWFMIAVIAVIIVVFVLYFGSSGGGSHTNAIAIVDKRMISEAELHDEYEKLLDIARLNLKEKLTPEVLKKMDLKAKAYHNLLNREIIIAKAADLKIQISDKELRTSIMSMPMLQTDGAFDETKYRHLLRYNRMSAQDFETLQRADLTANKIESFVREGVKISDKEAYDLYVLQNRKINVHFLQISGADIKNKIETVESELEDYLKRNGNLFRIPEQIKIKYLFFAADSSSANISEEDIKDYYSSYKDKYKTKDGKEAPPDKVRGDIIKDMKKIRGMQTAQTEARKAREEIYQENNMDAYGQKRNLTVRNSEFFPINKPPQEFASVSNVNDVLLNVQKGDLSKVLSADNGYYLLQVADKQSSYVPKLNVIENQVRQRFIESESMIRAEREAKSILERLKAGESFEKVASEKSLKIHETGLFRPGNIIPQIGENPDAVEILMQLSSGKPYTEKPLLVNNAYFILKFKETSQPDDQDFEAQKEMYKKLLTAMKQEEAMRTWLEGNKTAMIKEKRVRIKKKVEDL
ncbi:MAG: SurA N-terminal domain-containing protein [Syntrophaceae bacterium]|nr:SurA N-terminal domain-containing protein [Syntrophaceae bacterium]